MSDYSPSDALPTIQNLTSRVRELEAELADLREQRNEMLQDVTTWRYRAEKSDERLADLRASSVVVRRKCLECGGTGLDFATVQLLEPVRCPDCDNGWQLAEGVIPVVRSGMPDRWYHSFTEVYHGLVIPARLIEGDTDE